MLGNLLGRIDNLFLDNVKDVQEHIPAIEISQEAIEVMSTKMVSEFDKRKVTFSESVMEKTISTRTSYESGAYYGISFHGLECIDTSHELGASIDNGIEELDNEISLNTEPSFLAEEMEPQSIESFLDENPTSADHSPIIEYRDEQDPFTQATPDKHCDFLLKSPLSSTFTNSPLKDDTQYLDTQHGHIIDHQSNSFSSEIAAIRDVENVRDAFHENSDIGIKNVSIIDDFKQMKLDLETNEDQVNSNNILEQFQSSQNISDILSEDDFLELTESNSNVKDCPNTPKSDYKAPDFMSPGSFFSRKSGSLGALGTNCKKESRPIWYTPKVDEKGNYIDEIPDTPSENLKLLHSETPKKTICTPMYDSPSGRMHDSGIQSQIIHDINSRADKMENESDPKLAKSDRSSSVSNADSNKLLITFPETVYRHESRVCMSINNPTPKIATWLIKSIGPAYISSPKLKQHPLEDSVFKFLSVRGKVKAGSQIDLAITFFPLIVGEYSQTFHLITNGQVIVLELTAKSMVEDNKAKVKSRYSTSSNNGTLECLDFGSLSKKGTCTKNVKVCNSTSDALEFEFSISEPFHIPIKKIWIDPNSYLNLPVAFLPKKSGSFKASLVMNASRGKVQKLNLTGIRI